MEPQLTWKHVALVLLSMLFYLALACLAYRAGDLFYILGGSLALVLFLLFVFGS